MTRTEEREISESSHKIQKTKQFYFRDTEILDQSPTDPVGGILGQWED